MSHHLSRLEAATGAKLVQRVRRGIRLTPEGELLARRATELDAAVAGDLLPVQAQFGGSVPHRVGARFQFAGAPS
ncbi:LysR family transcriptional regulator [Streptomyces sp. MAR4 CNY-716]